MSPTLTLNQPLTLIQGEIFWGAIFRGAILRSPKNVPTPTIPHKMFWDQLTRAGKVSLIADFV